MEKPDYRTELSFCCSPLAVDVLDEMILRHRFHSRGELLREIIEFYLAKARVAPAALKQIQAHHDRLNMVRPRRTKRQPIADSNIEADAVASVG
jgi:Arc/MetJ-type ribon-helix-helix transcriptional regulator